MPALGFEICHDICWMLMCSFLSGSLSPYPCLNVCKVFQSSVRIFWLHTLGGILLHVEIAQMDKCHIVPISRRKCRIFPTTSASVASWLLVSQTMFRHDVMITTLRRHLWHLIWLIWRSRTDPLKSNNSWYLKEALKHWFGGGTLPYYSCRSAGTPLLWFKQCYNAP